MASIFTAAKPINPFNSDLGSQITEAIQGENSPEVSWSATTPASKQKQHIGIVIGHWGDNNDPGAVCENSDLTELRVNQDIGSVLQRMLIAKGFSVDLLKEFDDRLEGYQADALISLHADSCTYINDQATGFKIAGTSVSSRTERTARLASCIRNRYAITTGLSEHRSITADMTEYHAFAEIDPFTPAIILETGFLNLDQEILTQHSDQIASGIVAGILCYMNNESIHLTPMP
ncbi:MAG: N-acetylmuramoyl-L-alanine amidase [Chloroflexota bacterium]